MSYGNYTNGLTTVSSYNGAVAPTVLFLGATGQVGGPFLTEFRSKFPDYKVTAFLRSTALDAKLEALGVKAVHGTFDDLALISELASKNDIILNLASSNNPAVTEAILKGAHVERRRQPRKILLHMSGAGNFVDESHEGVFKPIKADQYWNDANPEHIKKINKNMQPNGACDELIFQAVAKDEIIAYFVCPAGIHGNSKNNALAVKGVEPSPGVWMNYSLTNVKQLGFSPYVGPGTSVFRVVHVDDVVSLTLKVFEKAVKEGQDYVSTDVYKNWYFCIDETKAAKDLAELFTQATGKQAKSVSYDEAGITKRYLASNSYLKDDNARSLGWSPKGPSIAEVIGKMSKST